MKRNKIIGLPAVFVGILGVLVVAAVVFGVEAVSMGSKLSVLEKKEQKMVSRNQELKENLALYSSYSEIGKQAERLGMAKPGKYIYLTSEGVALR